MLTQRLFFTKDATGTRAELRVNANPSTSHDRESEVGPLDQVASERIGRSRSGSAAFNNLFQPAEHHLPVALGPLRLLLAGVLVLTQ